MSNIEISGKNIISLLLALNNKNTQLLDEEKQQINYIGRLLDPESKDKNTNRSLAEQNLFYLLEHNTALNDLFKDFQQRLAKIPDETLIRTIPKRDELRANRPDLFPDPQVVERGPRPTLIIESSDEIENVALDIFSLSDPQEAIQSLDLKIPEQILSL